MLAGGHAAELAPRSPDVMQAQAWPQASPRQECNHLEKHMTCRLCGPLVLVPCLRR